jgi:hypothetical protein
LFVCLMTSAAQAQVTRTFVSGTGTANSSCSYTAPCRFFTQAIAALPSQGGEIDVLDPGSYGQITITNSVSIIGRGWTTITATSSTAAIAITGSGTVSIIGVQLDGGGTGQTGISFSGSSGILTVQDCVIRKFASSGIAFSPNVPENSTAQPHVSNTTLASNGGHGAYVQPSGLGFVTATFDHVQANDNADDGIGLYGNFSGYGDVRGIQAVVSDSTVSGNYFGFHSFTTGSNATTILTVTRSTVTYNNGWGLAADGIGAVLNIGQSTITGNNNDWSAANNSAVQSYGDNYLGNNDVNTGPPPAISRE